MRISGTAWRTLDCGDVHPAEAPRPGSLPLRAACRGVTKPSRLYAGLLANPNRIIAFRDLERMLRAAGFELKRRKGSHRTWKHPAIAAVLTIQPNGKDAEPYRVDAFIVMVEANGLEFDS